MKPALFPLFLAASLVASLSHPGPGDVKDKQAIVKKARAAYYNLPRVGVMGYRCEVVTDWRTCWATWWMRMRLNRRRATEPESSGVHSLLDDRG